MNGIYHVDFVSPLGSGSGTVFLENGIMRGGDAVIAYHGTYALTGDTVRADVSLIKHGAGFSVLGDATNFSLLGKVSGNGIKGTGTVPGIPLQAQISLRKVGDLLQK